jgi:aminopeptidase N
VQLAYSGTPEPVPAPTTRSDFSTSGWTITDAGGVWTMQEPFGAYTWYAVNDQPADKALYDFTLRVAAPWTGIANGSLTRDEVVDGDTVTSFHLAEPASSYLVTVAFGDYAMRTDETASGTPVTYWAPRAQQDAFEDLRYGARAIEWVEARLGPYPFSSAGILLTDSDSGMETQTLLTLGDNPYVRSREVIVHEMVHQWYGDLVTPTDWRDVWMNEGMTMYLQLVYRAESEHRDIDAVMNEVADFDQGLRNEAGPPGAYDPAAFGESNIYYCPALMWHELRGRVGEREFWRLLRDWPRVHAYANATRTQWFDWVEDRTGLELSRFFRAWIMGRTTPPRHWSGPDRPS